MAKRPSILIPIPWAYLDEQRKNASYAKNFGIAYILDQDSLTPSIFLSRLKQITKDWKQIVDDVRDKKSPDKDAATKLVDIMEELLK
jgi:UDP-N-acetylglucosamine:LPS N-acetylglucosamine transferase